MKKMMTGLVLFSLMLVLVFPVMAGGGAQLKGQTITLGQYWGGYDVNTVTPTTETGELELDWRKKIQKDNGFTMSQTEVAGWGEMLETVVTSVMAGKPAANAFFVTPEWAMALHRQKLLYPLSDSKAINLKNNTDAVGKTVAYNQTIGDLFTFSGKQYALAIGYGGSRHSGGVFFNKRLYREAGLSPDTPYDMQKNNTWTWNNFLDVCKKLTRDRNNTGRIDTYAMAADLSTEILDQIVYSNGAHYIERDRTGKLTNGSNTPAFIEALQFARRLMTEGVMMPRPEGSNWDWHWPMFHDGYNAMLMEPTWRIGQLADMTDDWGYVFFPKGPRSANYCSGDDENVIIVPSTYKPAEVDAILKAIELWFTPVSLDWKSGMYSEFRDRRAVDETMAMFRDSKYLTFRNNQLVPGLNRGDIAWQMWWYDGEPAQLVEEVSQNWNALIAEANG